jgi:microcin C transport system substrate-binding protein
MVYNQQRLSRPPQMPPYVTGEIWAVFTWWSR